MGLMDGWTAAEKAAGVKQSNTLGLGGAGVSAPGYVFKGTVAGPSGGASSAYDDLIKKMTAELSGSNATLRAMQAQLAAQPKLPKFDYAGSMARAQQTAASTVNPVYTDKLNRYLEKNAVARTQETTARTRTKEDIANALAQALEDSKLNRGRTIEDTTNKMADIVGTENTYQKQEGRQFDQARSALLGDIANAGLTESGIGQNQIQTATTDRNIESEQQVNEFGAQKRDTEIFKTRTLADLDTTDTRERGGATRRTENEDIALRNFIENQGLEERDTRANLETERTLAINDATRSAYQGIIAQTIAALTGSGARAQDVGLFKQIYG